MCIKISNFFLTLAPLMMIQKGIISQMVLYEEELTEIANEATKNVTVKQVTANIGKHAILICPELNGTTQYTWLKNTEPLKDSENIKILDNGRELRLLVTTLQSNYTCKCEAADCKSYTFQFLTMDEKLEEWNNSQEKKNHSRFHIDHLIVSMITTFGDFYRENENTYHVEKPDLFADEQKILFENVGLYKKKLILLCSESVFSLDEYNWLKNNIPVKIIEPNAHEQNGNLIIVIESEEQSGNYTCICKDTSCKLDNHTYQVIANEPKKKDLSFESSLISNQTQIKSSISWSNVIDVNWWYSIWFAIRSLAPTIRIELIK